MFLQVSALSSVPIYEQIEQQIKEQIFDGSLQAGVQLPSIRMLAKELKVGVITAKRAYDDLCNEGLLISRQGKGVFVAEINKEQAVKAHEKIIAEQLSETAEMARQYSISREKFLSLAETAYEFKEEQHNEKN